MKRLSATLTILVVSVGAAEADLLLGITATHLVSIDPANPAAVTPIGPLNLPANITHFALAWDPVQPQLFGLGYERSGAAIVNQHLIGYSVQTGQGTLLAALGSPAAVGLYEALEYVDALGTLIASREGTFGSQVTTRLVRLAASGRTSLQATTTRDNDFAVYDPVRNLL